jgi:prepilin-type N-terminal cleavage/methylation domain-containing protein
MNRFLQNNLRSRGRGFSLLELILAMTMAAMLALSLYTAMSVTIRARRSAALAVEPTRAAVIAADLLRRDLESVLPPTGVLAGPFIGVHLAGTSGGDSDTAQFCTIGADPRPIDAISPPLSEGIRRVELLVIEDASPPLLVRRVTRNLLASTEPQVEDEIICRGVRSFSLRYFDGLSWQENWDSTTLGDVLPMAVSITLELDDPALQTPRRITRVVPLSCAQPSDIFSMEGM